jgi:ferredoxin-NADP reductase
VSLPTSRALIWRIAKVAEVRQESPTARTLVLDVPDWPGHLAGQHVDVRLTAPDGYTAQRSYSIADAADGDRVEITVQEVEDGEVSTYLCEELRTGDSLELRGPVGGYFVWRPAQPEPVLLVGGGSGVVPLRAMIRARAAADSRSPMRLVYSVRRPADVLYAEELHGAKGNGLSVEFAYTREAPPGVRRPPGRIDARFLTPLLWPPGPASAYVCGPTSFVESMADILVAAGYVPGRVRTERFG